MFVFEDMSPVFFFCYYKARFRRLRHNIRYNLRIDKTVICSQLNPFNFFLPREPTILPLLWFGMIYKQSRALWIPCRCSLCPAEQSSWCFGPFIRRCLVIHAFKIYPCLTKRDSLAGLPAGVARLAGFAEGGNMVRDPTRTYMLLWNLESWRGRERVVTGESLGPGKNRGDRAVQAVIACSRLRPFAASPSGEIQNGCEHTAHAQHS